VLIDTLLVALEHLGLKLTDQAETDGIVPPLGTRLQVTRALTLTGTDLGPPHPDATCTCELPAGTLLEVVQPYPRDAGGCWVRPIDHDYLLSLPQAARKRAAAYGFILEVPPGCLRSHARVSSQIAATHPI